MLRRSVARSGDDGCRMIGRADLVGEPVRQGHGRPGGRAALHDGSQRTAGREGRQADSHVGQHSRSRPCTLETWRRAPGRIVSVPARSDRRRPGRPREGTPLSRAPACARGRISKTRGPPPPYGGRLSHTPTFLGDRAGGLGARPHAFGGLKGPRIRSASRQVATPPRTGLRQGFPPEPSAATLRLCGGCWRWTVG